MSTVKLEIQLSSQQLLQTVEQLDDTELEQFLSQVIILHTQRKSAQLLTGDVEVSLNHHYDPNCHSLNYYIPLITKTEKQMTEEEYRELLRLSEQIDQLQAHRFEYLADLANLHGISLTELMMSLGFQA